MELPKKITDEIWDYCRLNGITDINGFTIKMISQGFTVEKYGATPSERVIEKIVEKIVEVEKEVEVIKEVEKIVEKEVYITDDEASKELTEKINERDGTITYLREAMDALVKEGSYQSTQFEEFKKVSKKELDTANLKINELITELELEKSKPKQEIKKDIYGEDKIGFFGSNTSNI